MGRLKRQHIDNELLWKKIITLLGFMMCAKRPFLPHEIECALCLQLDHENGIVLEDVAQSGLVVQVKELCGTLIRESGGRFELVHSTARTYELPRLPSNVLLTKY
jgi:hypothetical protein